MRIVLQDAQPHDRLFFIGTSTRTQEMRNVDQAVVIRLGNMINFMTKAIEFINWLFFLTKKLNLLINPDDMGYAVMKLKFTCFIF